MTSSSCNTINFRWSTSFSLQGTCKLSRSLRSHLHPDVIVFAFEYGSPFRKKNIVLANLPVALFLKCHTTFSDYRIQTSYLSTGLFGSICASGWSSSPISGGSYVFVYMVTVDIRVNLTFKMTDRKCEQKVSEIEKMYEMSLIKRKQQSHISDFLSSNTFLF